jgi:tetratricopeptide (TPR) repeat protein
MASLAHAQAASSPTPADTQTAATAPSSKVLPLPEEIVEPRERLIFSTLFTEVSRSGDSAEALASLDETLTRLPEPTKLRGLVQSYRAAVLLDLHKFQAAIDAIEESIRLLPGYSGPLITAASIYAYANQPGRGADYLLRASRVDPATVSLVDDYEVNNILRRLSVAREERRVEALSDRLLEIGWVGSNLGSRSVLAREAIDRRLSDARQDAARQLVPKLLVPAHSYSLLYNNRYKAIWADVETWSGPRLEKQWSIYLAEARERWRASKDVSAAGDYTGALASAGHDKTIIREILPLFSRKLDEHEDHDLIFVVSPVAGALARQGRWRDIEILYERVEKVWPLGSQANALNIAGNRAKYLLTAGKAQQALQRIDAVIADARKWEVNADAVASMHHNRACMLHELGRKSEASVAAALAAAVQYPASVAGLHLCLENPQAARQALLLGLQDEVHRDDVLWFLQKSDERIAASDYARKMNARIQALKGDPEILKEAAKYGRILSFAANEAAPAEQP